MCGIMRGVVHKVDGAFGAVHQLVARRGQGVREAVVPRTRCGCGRLGSLRGLGRAHRRWLRRAAEARGRVVARVAEVRRGAARRRHLLREGSSTETDGAASAGQPRVCMCGAIGPPVEPLARDRVATATETRKREMAAALFLVSVSYTHLTLPTICSV